jgi:prophage regulatory protein
MTQTILRLPAVRERTGLSRSSIYLKISEGKFPRPLSLGARAIGFLASEVDEWIASLQRS